MTETVLAYFPTPAQGVWHLGPVPIRAYALCIIAGIVVAIWLTQRRWKARGGDPDDVMDIAMWAVPFGIVGGRLYHVITDPELYFLPGRDPIKAFYKNVTDYDAQIADLWLHPYFRQYGAHELLALVEGHGLKFQRWLNPAIDFSLLDGLPGFEALNFREKCRVAQIINHADLKLSAVFAK